MQQERKPRLVRVNDFVADNLEAEADKMPVLRQNVIHPQNQ
jgi:hypothetical protein